MAALAMSQSFAAAPKLRYELEPGQKYLYELKIVATFPEAVETREGLSTYTVKSAANQQFTVAHSGHLSTGRKATSGQPLFGRPDFLRHFPWVDNPFVRAGEFTISAQGKVIRTEVGTALPYMLGDLEFLAFEELPAEAKSKWEQKREVTITQRNRSRFPHSPFAPAASSGVNHSAQEQVTFTVARSEGHTVRLKKEYALRSDEKVEGNPRFELTGEGELVFDLQRGLFQSQSMNYTYRLNETNLTFKVPLTVECRLLDATEAAQRLKAQEEARAAAQAAAAKANEPKALAAGEREKLLRELKAKDEWTVRGAADRLAKAPADAQPEEVATALTALLSERSSWIRAAAAKALVNWGTTKAAPALCKATADEDLWVRKAAMEALGRLKTPEGAQAVAARLVPMQDRGDAAKALKTMGPPAEPAVLPYLKDRDGWVRLEACKVLGEIGSPKSLPALEEFGGNGRGFDKPESEKAIQAIKARN
jgi:hypothetical protein